jgi:hypothetical protein
LKQKLNLFFQLSWAVKTWWMWTEQCWNLRNFEFKSRISDPIQSFYFCYYIIMVIIKIGYVIIIEICTNCKLTNINLIIIYCEKWQCRSNLGVKWQFVRGKSKIKQKIMRSKFLKKKQQERSNKGSNFQHFVSKNCGNGYFNFIINI